MSKQFRIQVWYERLGTCTLIVTEKPDAAFRIASALDASGNAKRAVDKGVPYYVAQREGKIVVVPALGHLYTVVGDAERRGQYPVFKVKWVPKYEAERGAARFRVWLQTIAKLAKDADILIDACDYDIEGSIIGYCILKYACGGRENAAKRMKYSTLIEEELQKSYSSLLPHLDFALIEAGLARHELDWLYGINLSRALTSAVKNASGQYAPLSTGRVQGPTMKFLALREKSIGSFIPTPYWSVKAMVKIGKAIFEAEHERKIFVTLAEAEAAINACEGAKGELKKVLTKRLLQAPPTPFDLGGLQSEAYRVFGYTPMRTSSIAQRLYLDALISYPRTSSQKLPREIGYEGILKNLAKAREYNKLAGELLAKPLLKPTEGKKQDSAHPAIHPTGKLPEKTLGGAEKNVWNLVVRRFMAVFGEPAIRQVVEATININGENFFLTGRRTLEEGWFRFYQPFVRLKDVTLPRMEEGQEITVEKVALEGKFTKPPPRYNPSSLLKKMEKADIGTKATRAGIMQTLYDRKYIRENLMEVTDLGFEVTDVLRRYCPSVMSVEFTRQLEEKMDEVQQGKLTREQILAEAVEILKPVIASLKENEKAVGEQLNRALQKSNLEERIIGDCPTCQNGKLIIQYSKKTRKRFVGCTNYFNGACKTAFPLPQTGFLKTTGKACGNCGGPIVQVLHKGKRPWNLCPNPECSSKTRTRKQ